MCSCLDRFYDNNAKTCLQCHYSCYHCLSKKKPVSKKIFLGNLSTKCTDCLGTDARSLNGSK